MQTAFDMLPQMLNQVQVGGLENVVQVFGKSSDVINFTAFAEGFVEGVWEWR